MKKYRNCTNKYCAWYDKYRLASCVLFDLDPDRCGPSIRDKKKRDRKKSRYEK